MSATEGPARRGRRRPRGLSARAQELGDRFHLGSIVGIGQGSDGGGAVVGSDPAAGAGAGVTGCVGVVSATLLGVLSATLS